MYKNAAAVITDVGLPVYTAPAGKVALVKSIHLASINATDAKVSVQLKDASAGASFHLIQGVIVPAMSALSILDGTLVLEPGDQLIVQAETSGSAHAVLSLMESPA